jgi:hypothetical protein
VHLSTAGVKPAEREKKMKQTLGALLLFVLLVSGLVMAGCSKKQEASSPAEKPVAAPQSVNMQEGKWEITNAFEMQGMPGMMEPHTFTTCLSQKDYVPKDTEQKDCTMKDARVEAAPSSGKWSARTPAARAG